MTECTLHFYIMDSPKVIIAGIEILMQSQAKCKILYIERGSYEVFLVLTFV